MGSKAKGYRAYQGGRKWRPAVKLILAVVLILVLLFAGLAGTVTAGSRTVMTGEEPEVMIVLGCQVKPWGPSVLLQDRLDTALALWKEHPDMTVVVSGGQGPDEHISEAECMYDYLTEHGVDKEKVLKEEQSHNTLQNLRYSLALLSEHGFGPETETVVVSNGFHLARVKMLYGRTAGTTEHLSLAAAPSSDAPARVKMFFREPLALAKSFLFDR